MLQMVVVRFENDITRDLGPRGLWCEPHRQRSPNVENKEGTQAKSCPLKESSDILHVMENTKDKLLEADLSLERCRTEAQPVWQDMWLIVSNKSLFKLFFISFSTKK